MKNLILTVALLLAAITTGNAQSGVTIGSVTISYNAEAAEKTGFRLDVSFNPCFNG